MDFIFLAMFYILLFSYDMLKGRKAFYHILRGKKPLSPTLFILSLLPKNVNTKYDNFVTNPRFQFNISYYETHSVFPSNVTVVLHLAFCIAKFAE